MARWRVLARQLAELGQLPQRCVSYFEVLLNPLGLRQIIWRAAGKGLVIEGDATLSLILLVIETARPLHDLSAPRYDLLVSRGGAHHDSRVRRSRARIFGPAASSSGAGFPKSAVFRGRARRRFPDTTRPAWVRTCAIEPVSAADTRNPRTRPEKGWDAVSAGMPGARSSATRIVHSSSTQVPCGIGFLSDPLV